MMMKQVIRAAVCVCVLGGLLAAPAVAKRITVDAIYFGGGVDKEGNFDPSLGGSGATKLTKYTKSGIILARWKAMVTNESGKRTVFNDLPCGLTDPETNDLYLSTSSRFVIKKGSGENGAKGKFFCVYNPNKVKVPD